MHMLLNFAMLQDAANQTLTSLNQVQTTAQPDAAAGEISLSIWELKGDG